MAIDTFPVFDLLCSSAAMCRVTSCHARAEFRELLDIEGVKQEVRVTENSSRVRIRRSNQASAFGRRPSAQLRPVRKDLTPRRGKSQRDLLFSSFHNIMASITPASVLVYLATA
jgi:hypothetical protein